MKDDKGKPIVSDTQFADISGAYAAVMAVQGGLLQRSKSGTGAFVDVALADAVNPFLALPYALHQGGLDYRQFNLINGKTTANYAAYQCADGKWLAVAALELKFWNNICDLVDKPAWKRESQEALFNARFPKMEVEKLFKTKSQAQWMALFHGKDVCVAPILEIEELENSAYHQAKHTFEPFQTDQGTTLHTIALPFKTK
ncbi:MAG: CoA transferase [Bacteroidota bacterium]